MRSKNDIPIYSGWINGIFLVIAIVASCLGI